MKRMTDFGLDKEEAAEGFYPKAIQEYIDQRNKPCQVLAA